MFGSRPQPAAMVCGARFNRTAFFLKGAVLGTEMRALGNLRTKECFDCPGGQSSAPRMTPPLTAWGPNINIVRDPRFLKDVIFHQVRHFLKISFYS